MKLLSAHKQVFSGTKKYNWPCTNPTFACVGQKTYKTSLLQCKRGGNQEFERGYDCCKGNRIVNRGTSERCMHA